MSVRGTSPLQEDTSSKSESVKATISIRTDSCVGVFHLSPLPGSSATGGRLEGGGGGRRS